MKQAEEDQWREKIQAADGISEEEAIEIATKQMKTILSGMSINVGKALIIYSAGV